MFNVFYYPTPQELVRTLVTYLKENIKFKINNKSSYSKNNIKADCD